MIREIQAGEGDLVAEVPHELRPHRRGRRDPALVDAPRAEGHRVAGSFVDDVAVAAAGFRSLCIHRRLPMVDAQGWTARGRERGDAGTMGRHARDHSPLLDAYRDGNR